MRIFDLFAPVTLTLTLTQMTFILELDLYSQETYTGCAKMNFLRQRFESFRITACGCMHLVTRGHFRSRDIGDDHTIRSAIAENLTLHAKFTAFSFIEPELLPTEVLHCTSKDFRPVFAPWPRLWPDDLHIRTWPVFARDIPDVQIWTSYVKVFESYRLRDIHVETDRQTRPKLYTKPLRGGQLLCF